MSSLRTPLAFGFSLLLSACSQLPQKLVPPVKISYLSFQTLDSAKPLAEAGILRVPVDDCQSNTIMKDLT